MPNKLVKNELTRTEEAHLANQIKLKLQKALPTRFTERGIPSFIVDDCLQISSFANGSETLLGIGPSDDGNLSSCRNLTPEQVTRLGDGIRDTLLATEDHCERFVRLETQTANGRLAFCVTLAPHHGESDEAKSVKCVMEPLAKTEQPPQSAEASALSKVGECLAWTLDPSSRIFECLGHPEETNRVSLPLEAFINDVIDQDREEVLSAFTQLINGERDTLQISYRTYSEDGRLQFLTSVAQQTRTQDERQILGLHHVHQDKHIMHEDLQLFSYLARKVQLSILVYTPEGAISWCNNAFIETTGYELEEIEGLDPNTLLRGPLTDPKVVRHMNDRMRRGKAFHAEIVQYKKNGSPYWVRINGNPLLDEHGRVTRFISFQTDITESKKTQSAILRNEIKFRSLFDNSNDALLLISPKDGVIIEANRSAIQLLDTDRLVGQRLEEIFPGNSHFQIDYLNDLIDKSSSRSQRESGEFANGAGEIKPVELTVSRTPIGESMALFVTLRDVSEKRILEEQLRHAQRMEAVGRLAGGIAHDFNNLLAGQRGFTELLCNSRDLSKRDNVYANEILKITDRASKLTSRLLSFSRGKSEKPVVANLNEMINNMLPMLSRILKKEVDFRSQLDPELGNVRVDTNQIDQVIMNLVVNGQEAITSQNGIVTLETSMVELSGDELFITGKPEAGRYVKLLVSDNGQGISRSVLEKIFEPFFTTKKGAGTGLGLSIVYGIIQSNDGHLMVESSLGVGTEFSCYFPQVSEAVKAESTPDLQERMPSAAPAKNGDMPTILVAEDQEQVREILELGLGQSGYNLVVAKDGQEAIELGRAHKGKIDLLLTDSLMPRASGLLVVKEMRAIYPELKVVLVSGLPQSETAELQNIKIDAFVDKPFSIRKLLELIQSLVGVAD